MRTLISDTINKIGQSVTVSGWVNTRRDHGNLEQLKSRAGLRVPKDDVVGRVTHGQRPAVRRKSK